MTRNDYALRIHAVYHIYSDFPVVHEFFAKSNLLRDHDVMPFRALQRRSAGWLAERSRLLTTFVVELHCSYGGCVDFQAGDHLQPDVLCVLGPSEYTNCLKGLCSATVSRRRRFPIGTWTPTDLMRRLRELIYDPAC